jgi:hypothetical protein
LAFRLQFGPPGKLHRNHVTEKKRITMGGPKFWRDRAAEARRLADRILDPRSKFILSKIIEEYEELARVTGRTTAKRPRNTSEASCTRTPAREHDEEKAARAKSRA